MLHSSLMCFVFKHHKKLPWLLCISTTAPVVMRSYDVDFFYNANELYNNSAQLLHKKIIFKNPWDIARKFTLVSSDEGVMKPR